MTEPKCVSAMPPHKERVMGDAHEVESPADLVRIATELLALIAERDETIRRLRLALALREWKPQRKRGGAPKKIDLKQDIDFLEKLESFMARKGIRSRAAALSAGLEMVNQKQRESGLPRRSATKDKQEMKTLKNRLSLAAKARTKG